MTKPKKQASGGARLIAAGKRPVNLGLSPADKSLIDQAAAAERMPTTVFITRAAVAAAKKVVAREEPKNPNP